MLLSSATAIYYGTNSVSKVYLGSTQKWPTNVPVSGDPSLSLGTQVSWTSGTYFDSWTSQSGVTTEDAPGTPYTNNLCWQMFYSHVALKISATTQRAGVATAINGTNTIRIRAAIASANNTQTGFTSEAQYASQSFSYTAGGFNQLTFTSQLNIPANRYFLLGVVSGPFYRTFKTLAANRTAVVGGTTAAVTAINKTWWGAWPSGPTTGIPTQLGGSSTFTEWSNIIPVTSYKFETV
jgi:hypothetical protein